MLGGLHGPPNLEPFDGLVRSQAEVDAAIAGTAVTDAGRHVVVLNTSCRLQQQLSPDSVPIAPGAHYVDPAVVVQIAEGAAVVGSRRLEAGAGAAGMIHEAAAPVGENGVSLAMGIIGVEESLLLYAVQPIIRGVHVQDHLLWRRSDSPPRTPQSAAGPSRPDPPRTSGKFLEDPSPEYAPDGAGCTCPPAAILGPTPDPRTHPSDRPYRIVAPAADLDTSRHDR